MDIKKDLKIILLLLLILVIIGFVFRGLNLKQKEITSNVSEVPSDDLIVAGSFEEKTLNQDNDYVTFDVKYPSFVKADDNFNSGILTLVQSKMNDHIEASKEYWQARYDTQTEGENISKVPSKEDKLSFFSDFEIAQSNSTYISFVLHYGGFSGGAHGYEEYVPFNYDIKNHKVITLADVFPNNPNYLNYLSQKSREMLKAQYATVSEEDKKNSDPEALKEYVDNINSMIDTGTEPKEENFSTFTFTPDKIKIYFADYQVGPHAMGMPVIEIDRK